mgnify:CR=1 FL=1
MLRYLLIFIIVVHGLIHLLGFLKAFELASIEQLTQTIGKPMGLLWLVATLLFLVTGVTFLLNSQHWFWWALTAVVLSQILIFSSWQDAKVGTIANGIILVAAIVGLGTWSFENGFRKEVRAGLQRGVEIPAEILAESDLEHLPAPVQRYLRYTGAVGQPKVKNFRATFEGQMRKQGEEWFNFTSEQYNFFDEPERLFFMKARVKGLPTAGYHAFKAGAASMDIRVLSLIPVAHQDGELLRQAETVTLFNDMCLMAPATLIDERIKWTAIDKNTAKADFTNHDITISATLYFNEKGALVNFISNDRYEVNVMQQLPFSTPVQGYQTLNNRQVMRSGDAVWHYPEGEFVYGKFGLKSLDYNVETF